LIKSGGEKKLKKGLIKEEFSIFNDQFSINI